MRQRLPQAIVLQREDGMWLAVEREGQEAISLALPDLSPRTVNHVWLRLAAAVSRLG